MSSKNFFHLVVCLVIVFVFAQAPTENGSGEASHIQAPAQTQGTSQISNQTPPVTTEAVSKEPEIHDLLAKLHEEETQLKKFHNDDVPKSNAASSSQGDEKYDDSSAEEANLLQNVDNLLQDIQKHKIKLGKPKNAQKRDEDEYEDDDEEEAEDKKKTSKPKKEVKKPVKMEKVEKTNGRVPQAQQAPKSTKSPPHQNMKPAPKVVKNEKKNDIVPGAQDQKFYKKLKTEQEEIKMGITKPKSKGDPKASYVKPKQAEKEKESPAAHDARIYKDINHVFQSVLALYKEFMKFKKQTKINFLKEKLQTIKVRNELLKEIDVLKANVYHHQDLRLHGDYNHPEDFHNYQEKGQKRGSPERNPHFKDEL